MIDQSVRYQEMAEQAIATRDAENGVADAAATAAARLAREAAEEDLARAPQKDRDALRKEQERVRRARGAVAQAEQAASQARDDRVAASRAGQTVSDRLANVADAALATAKRDVVLAVDVLERLEARMVADVRADRRRQATASLAEIAQRRKVVAARLVGTFDAIAELGRLRAAEEAAAHDLAGANGEPEFRWSFTHQVKVPLRGFGAQYVTSPKVDLGMVADGVIVTRAELAERLGI